MIGSSHRTLIEHRTGPTGVSVEDGVEGTTGSVIATEFTMVYRFMAHRAVSYKTIRVKLKPVSPYDIIREPASIDRCHEFDVLFYNLWY